jgi:hypothetical protein
VEKDGAPYQPIPYKENMMLSGYYQSEKYFEGRGQEIRMLFTDFGALWELANQFGFLLKNSVSLHVRRGDYAKFPEVHSILDVEYYYRAITYIQVERNVENILVFSDDIPWCRENLKGEEFVLMDGLEDWEEIYLQSLCNHNIIANSSFSWWGAYLNENEDKIVVAPKVWFNPGFKYDHSKIYTEEMICL